MPLFTHFILPHWRFLAGILASGAMAAVYVRGGAGWLLGFIMLGPWLLALAACRTLIGSLLCAYAMSLAYTAAAFSWFGTAIGSYTQVGAASGLSLLLVAAPLFQPQFFAFVLVRHLVGLRHGHMMIAFASAAAWVATEYLVPRLLGDTLGHGLYPSRLLRQAAEIGGAAGLTFLLLLANEGISIAVARRVDGCADGWRVIAKPLALAALVPLLLAAYGFMMLSNFSSTPAAAGKPLRVGLIQSKLIDYEGQRQEKGAHAVVREVLDTHFAMSYDAVVRQRADVVLWSETAYPTTFGHPKSEAGAEFDREILSTINAAGVPFVFGTYDSDAAGEYNAAAFVMPDTGLLGFYRKTRLFPLTEYVPAWLDGATFRRWLPWTGNWRPGDGARVFPLRLSDGREIPVLPLICLDDMDTSLAINGARLGAQAILTMSNDSWFTADPVGAQLHQAAAAFRSIETRLPQFRVTTNGYSAVIDATGSVLAGTRMDERTLVIAELAVHQPAPTLMVMWGDWVGRAASAFLALLAAWAAFVSWSARAAKPSLALEPTMSFPIKVAVLPPAARLSVGLLRVFARGSLLGMCVAILLDETLRTNTLAQIRFFSGLFLLPEAASWCLLFAFSARATLDQGKLVLTRGAQRIELALSEIAGLELWRLPIPSAGIHVRLTSGQRWRYDLALANPYAFASALAAGAPLIPEQPRDVMLGYAQARLAIRRWRLDHPVVKFILLPLALAIPAFHLHQHIAYGSAFGEYYSYGLKAYFSAFALWWAAWAIGVVLCAALLRSAVEIGTLLAALVRPRQTIAIRLGLEHLARATLYLGLPSCLLLQIYIA